MRLFIKLIFCFLILIGSAFADTGKGDLKMDNWAVDYFITYIKGKHSKSPELFIISKDSSWATYYYCASGPGNCRGSAAPGIKICERESNTECGLFARGRTIKWKNGINPGKGKASRINSKWSDTEIIAKLTELGFIGGDSQNNSNDQTTTNEYKIEGEREIALSWEGYADLVMGTVKFNEANYKGTIILPTPNKDGTCDGNYSLKEGGKGTWEISCSNNLGGAGTLTWDNQGNVTGKGRDFTDKKIKFTVFPNG